METQNSGSQMRDNRLEEVKQMAGWYIGLGILLMIIGMAAMGRAALMTVASVILFGWILIGSGIVEIAHSLFGKKGAGGFLVHLLVGVIHLIVGLTVVANPGWTAAALTLIIAIFLIVGGVFRIVISFTRDIPNKGFLIFHGVVSLLLGGMIWGQWPISGLWVIGMFIGIEMFFAGISSLTLGLAAKNLTKSDG